jgi:hypothetical protein
MKNKKLTEFVILFCACILAIACSPRKATVSAAPPSTAPSASTSKAAPASAVVVFLEGSATAIKDSSYTKLDMGLSIPSGWRVQTGRNSRCDLKIGSLGTLRLSQDSSIELSSIDLGESRRAFSAKLLSGSVAAKVAKLGARDRFGVASQTAACSVRGTEFVLALAPDGSTRLAVNKGSVAVFPPALGPSSLGESVAADAVYEAILNAAPAIKSGEEATFEQKDLEASSKAWAKALPKIEALIKKEGDKADSSELLASSALQKELNPFLASETPLASEAQKAGSDSVKDFEQFQDLIDPSIAFKTLEPVETFDDPAFEGYGDQSKWMPEGAFNLIAPRQKKGAMRFEQTVPMPSTPGAGVDLYGNFFEKIPLRDYRSFGAVLKIAKAADSKTSSIAINVRVPDAKEGQYWIAALLYTIDEKKVGMGGRVDYYGSSSKNEYKFDYKQSLAIDQAYDLRVDIDPATKTVTWFLDGSKINETTVPSLDANLDSPAQLLLNSYRNTGALAATEADKVYWTRAAP